MQAQVDRLTVPAQSRYERRYGVYMASRTSTSNSSHNSTPSTLSGMVSHSTSASEHSTDEDIIMMDSTGIVIGPMPSLKPISIGIYRANVAGIHKVDLPPIITDLKGYKKSSAPKLAEAGPTERGRTKDREHAGGAGGLLKVPDDHRHGRSGTRPRVLAIKKPRLSLEAPITVPQKSTPLQSQPVFPRDYDVGQAKIDHDRPDLLRPPPAPKPPALLLRIPVPPAASSPTPKLSTQLQLTPISQALPSVVVSDSVEDRSAELPQPFLQLIALQLQSKVYRNISGDFSHHSDSVVSKPILSQLITTDLTNYRLNQAAISQQQSLPEPSQKKDKQKEKFRGRSSFFHRKPTSQHSTPAQPTENESSDSSTRSRSQDRQHANRSGSSLDHHRDEGSPSRPTWLKRKARGVVLMVSGCIKDPEGRRMEGGSVVVPVVAVTAPPEAGSGSDTEGGESRNSSSRTKKRNRDIVREHVRKIFGHHSAPMELDDSGLEEHWVYVERCLEQPNTSAVDMLAAGTRLPFGASPAPSARIQEAPAVINIALSDGSTDSGPETTFPVTGWSPSIERRSHRISIVDPEVSPLDGDVAESEWHLVLDQNSLVKEMDVGIYRDWAEHGAEKQCGICLEDYRPDDAVLRLASCSHWQHRDCLEQWFKSSRTCPVCRQDIDADSEERNPTRPALSVSPLYGSSVY